MSAYRMEDNTVVSTHNAQCCWAEERDWDGSNHYGRSSRSQYHYETLYCSRRGRYYLEHCSGVSGGRDWVEWLSPQAAAAWLVHNEYNIPSNLAEAAKQVTE